MCVLPPKDILTWTGLAPKIVTTSNGLLFFKAHIQQAPHWEFQRSAALGKLRRTASEVSCVPRMEASNSHERAIANVVDRISKEGRLDSSVIPEVTAALDFLMSRTDSEFLVHYLKWRTANPISK